MCTARVDGVVTVKFAKAESPLGSLLAVSVYEPAVTFATIKEPDNSPFESEQFAAVTISPDSVQFESLKGKAVPDTWTATPIGPEVSFNNNDNDDDDDDDGELVRANVSEAESSDELPVMVMV